MKTETEKPKNGIISSVKNDWVIGKWYQKLAYIVGWFYVGAFIFLMLVIVISSFYSLRAMAYDLNALFR